MTFLVQNWAKCSTSLNSPVTTLQSGVVVGAPSVFTYVSGTDNQATIAGANYFATKAAELSVGDLIYAVGTDANTFYEVSVVTLAPTGNTVTVVSSLIVGAVTSVTGTANRITSTGGATPVIDISAAYVGQASITTLGTIGTGVWAGTTITVNHGGTGIATTTAFGVICGGTTATGVFQNAGAGTAGQVLVSGGAAALPSFQTLPRNAWVTSVASPVTLAVNTSYQATLGTLLTFNMPALVAKDSVIEVVGVGAGGWLIQMSGGQTAHLNSGATTAGGSIASTNQYNCVTLLCVVADTTFVIIDSVGTLTLA